MGFVTKRISAVLRKRQRFEAGIVAFDPASRFKTSIAGLTP